MKRSSFMLQLQATCVKTWSSQLSILHLALGAFTARDGAIRCWLTIAIFAYHTCIQRPR